MVKSPTEAVVQTIDLNVSGRISVLPAKMPSVP